MNVAELSLANAQFVADIFAPLVGDLAELNCDLAQLQQQLPFLLADQLVKTVVSTTECHMTSVCDGTQTQLVGSHTKYGTEQTESGDTIESVETTGITSEECASSHVETVCVDV